MELRSAGNVKRMCNIEIRFLFTHCVILLKAVRGDNLHLKQVSLRQRDAHPIRDARIQGAAKELEA